MSDLPAPHDILAEQSLLGCILLQNDGFDRVSDFLRPSDFFEPQHQKLFEVFSAMIKSGRAATRITIKQFLPDDFKVAGLPFDQYIVRLAAEATTVLMPGTTAGRFIITLCDAR